MSHLIKPENYHALLDLQQTEIAIKKIKDFFLSSISTELRLRRVTAPLFVLKGLGMNDDLNGVERPVTFPIKDMNEAQAEVVHWPNGNGSHWLSIMWNRDTASSPT